MSEFNLVEEKKNIKNMLSYLDLMNTHTDIYTSKNLATAKTYSNSYIISLSRQEGNGNHESERQK